VIKLKDLLLEYSPHASEEFATDSKDGASKGLESKFKYFKKVSKEQSKHPKNSWWKSKAGVLSVDKKIVDIKYLSQMFLVKKLIMNKSKLFVTHIR